MKVQVGTQVVDTAAPGSTGGTARPGAGGGAAFVAGDQVWIDGRVRRVKLLVGRGAAAPLPDKVTPPMPATVVKVLVTVGDIVTLGQKLVTVAAMKMETALRSPRAGVVTAVRAVPGQQVRPGDELVVVEAS
ncbi:MAG: biotin/lipoyl-containing protein [Pseudomonadota bacterium]|nr:biotin/lipoyl-containing protein [Pseudomonadota bacterium]